MLKVTPWAPPDPPINEEDAHRWEEELPSFQYPSIRADFQKELLGDYTSRDKPTMPFTIPALTPTLCLSLKLYLVWLDTQGTTRAYDQHRQLLSDATGTEILLLYMVRKEAAGLVKFSPQHIDICPKSCIAYTGQFMTDHSIF